MPFRMAPWKREGAPFGTASRETGNVPRSRIPRPPREEESLRKGQGGRSSSNSIVSHLGGERTSIPWRPGARLPRRCAPEAQVGGTLTEDCMKNVGNLVIATKGARCNERQTSAARGNLRAEGAGRSRNRRESIRNLLEMPAVSEGMPVRGKGKCIAGYTRVSPAKHIASDFPGGSDLRPGRDPQLCPYVRTDLTRIVVDEMPDTVMRYPPKLCPFP
jgi:hypothetical protein